MAMKNWIMAFRLRTLPLALASVLMGNLLAAKTEKFDLGTLVLSLLTTVFLQILSNLANDLGDTQHGADHAERSGPARAVQTGAISQKSMKGAVMFFLVLSFGTGISLLIWSLGFNLTAFGVFLGIGLVAMAAAVFYTMGKRPYGYAGLGDISVLLFFGLTGVLGTYFLQTSHIDPGIILPALSCGFFSVGVLNLNNVRDIESDKIAGKYSIPVRIGREKAIVYHWFLLLSGIVTSLVFGYLKFTAIVHWAFVLSVPLLLLNGFRLQRAKTSKEIDPLLKQLALTTLVFVILFGTFAKI